MPKKILKAVIFMLVVGLGCAYAQITEEDIEYARERLIQEKNSLAEEKSQLKSLFKEVREIIGSVDSLKKENAILRDDLVELKEAKTKLESDSKQINIKNLELQQMLKKDAAKKEMERLKSELEKCKERGAVKEEKGPPVKKETVKKEAAKKETVKKDIPDDLVPLKKENAVLEAELTKLKEFNAALQKKAEGLYAQNQELSQAKDNAKSLGSMVEYLNKERAALKSLNEKLQQDILKLQDDTRKEKATLNEELGTAYVQAKLYDLAINAYEKSVALVPQNAEVYYDLGLLYKHNPPGDRVKAIRNFKKYLQLSPKAKNKTEVEYFIQMLTEAPDRKIGLW